MAWTAPRTWTAGETLTAALLNTHLRDNLNAAFPVGSLHFLIQAATSTVTDVNGMGLEQNGVAASRTTYSALNTLHSGLSYPWGSGDGSTTFNQIDLRGRELIAHATASGHADVNSLGDSDGLALASRTPKAAAHTHTGPSHTHGAGSYVIATGTVGSGSLGTTPNGGTAISGTSAAGGTGATGSGGAFSNSFVVGGIWWCKY